ncbi:putative O-methyltransferase [Nemania sp. FL0031]|nr:putative O-methyltransferase [Nemania sp. FL0031]
MSTITELTDILDGIEPEEFRSNDVDRLRLIESAKRPVSRIEIKEEKFFDLTFTQPVVFSALQTLNDLGLWKQWETVGGGPKSVDEVCDLCTPKCDLNLLRRLLRLLASVHIITETGQDHYKLFPRPIWKWVPSRVHHWDPSSINLPSFLAKTGYKEPQDNKNSNYADWSPGNLDFFGRCVADPVYQDSFSDFMTGWAKYKVPWPEFYDTTALVSGADLRNGGVLCVDLGGHHGIDLTRLLEKHPDIPAGSLVLQDLPEVLVGAKELNAKIKSMPHDMFNHRAYYFHAVFHDWSDDVSTQILRNVAAVMESGYSKVLIVEMVLPPTGASVIQSGMDVEMMALVSGRERTEDMWTKLINDSGLRIIKIWEDGRRNECLIEAELA